MSLHIESRGAGAPLLMIHGWGVHGGIWDGVAVRLAQGFRVHCVDLPGCGASPGDTSYSLDGLARQLSEHWYAEHHDEPVALCGWSLGGQIALHWALLAPSQVSKLVLVSTTPSFVQRLDWQCAMATSVLQEFSASLLKDRRATLKRFAALQVHGSADERDLLVSLRAVLASRDEPSLVALQSGLDILRDTDLRPVLSKVDQHALVVSGERDALIPCAASDYLAHGLPNAQLLKIMGAPHAPFLSHPDIFAKRLDVFLNE